MQKLVQLQGLETKFHEYLPNDRPDFVISPEDSLENFTLTVYNPSLLYHTHIEFTLPLSNVSIQYWNPET